MNLKTLLAAAVLAFPAAMATAQTDPAATPPTDQPADVGADATAGASTAADTPAADAGASANADVAAGATVVDQNGGTVGTIESVEGETAVLSTGSVRVGVPLSALAKGDKGLTIAMSKAEIEAAAAANAATN